jgi:HAE1 family hydrophobic/amphiphilic exporter-1
VENARPEVIRTENLIRQTRGSLRFLLASATEVEAKGGLDCTLQALPTFEETFAVAREKRPELADVRHRIGVAEELVTVADAGDKPRLDFKGGYGWRSLETDNSRETGLSWNLGVYLSFPIFDGQRTRGKVAQARSDLRSQELDQAKLLDSIALESREAVNAVREAAEIVKALTGTVTQAERLLVMAEKGYEYGVKIRLEVDDAELNLQQARGNLARGKRDYLVAMTGLVWVKGILGE